MVDNSKANKYQFLIKLSCNLGADGNFSIRFKRKFLVKKRGKVVLILD